MIVSIDVLHLTDNDDAEVIPSLVDIVLIDILLAVVGVILVSDDGFGADAVSVNIRFRRTDELLDVRFPSDELLFDELSNSSVRFINNGLFN